MRAIEPVDDPARRLDFIQALRGVAAMVVVLFHGRGSITGPAYLDLGDRLFGCGAAGVDLFFVISGFIMVHATWKLDGSGRSVARFLVKRLTRIWPVYVIATLAFLVATAALDTYLTTGAGARALGKAFIFYPAQRHGAPFFGNTPNGVGWTLTFEVWFYLLFGICLRVGRWRWWTLAALIATFAVAVPYLMTGDVSLRADHDYGMKPAVLDILASPLMWEFLAGVGIGVLYKSRFRIDNRPLLHVLASLAVLAVVWQFLSGYRPYQGPYGWGVGLIVMVLMLALKNKRTPIVVPRWLSWLGDVSFSLYLVHRIPQLGLPLLLGGTQFAPLLAGAGFFIATTTLSLVLAYVSWRFVERDLAEHCRDWLLGAVDRMSTSNGVDSDRPG